MTQQFAHRLTFVILLLCQLSICLGTENVDPNESTKYLDAVREFADNVLKYGRDTYGPKHTPLFVDGLNIHTHEPVKWIDPDGTKWILSNLASQQTLMRTLDGLSEVTGDSKYREAAMDAIRYAFEHVRTNSGLLYWGQGAGYDALRDEVWGSAHCLKIDYPHYELMWKVDPNETERFIEAYWSAHINDWSNLDFNRFALFSDTLEEPWNHEYQGGSTFFKSKRGGVGFFVTASSLIQAGTTLYRLSRQEQPLVWSKRLAKRFVDTRHPNTGISTGLYNRLPPRPPLGDDLKEHFRDLHTRVFPYDPFEEMRGMYFPEDTEAHDWISLFLVGEMLGEPGKELTQWALEELTAWGKAAYRKKDNSFIPILTDGTRIEGYVSKKSNHYGPKGAVAKPLFANLGLFWAYAVAYRTTSNEFMWEMCRGVVLGNSFGDVGKTPRDIPKLQTGTTCSDVYSLLGFLELYEKTSNPSFLQTAQCIGDNIVGNQLHKGFFVPSKKHIYTRFDCFEPLALLHLHTATKAKTESVPQVWPSCPLFVQPYRHKERGIDRRIIYALTESPEPPLSLQEAAAIGDVELVRSLLNKGVGVDSWECTLRKTSLQHAAMNGRREVVELLLTRGARIDAQDDFPGGTSLDYAAEEGYNEIVELLIAKGADVNAKRTRYPTGDMPLHSAVRAGHKDIVELLIAKGANVNAKTDKGETAISLAKKKGHTEIVELLRKHAVDDLPKTNATKSERFNDVADLVMTGEVGGRQQFGNYLFYGDVNGDGYQDILTTASNYDSRRGRAYLYHGGPDMDNKADNIFTGENRDDFLGEGAFLSDLNNDGFSDVIVGSLGYNNRTGRVYVYYGGRDMDANPDLIFEGEGPDSAFGRRIAAGDVNGDGHRDLFITAHRFDNYRGRVYLFYGGEPFDTVLDKKFDGEATNDTFGIFLSARGDVDGDGCDDLLVGTPYWPQNITKRGRAYLFFGDRGTAMDNVADVKFTGENDGDDLGVAIDLFDIDNDGYADVMIGARKWPSGTLHGRAYLHWGSDRSTFDNVADVIIDGQKDVKESFGGNVFYAGYINDDKYGDFIIGAYDYFRTSREGRAYLFYGGTKTTIDTDYDHVFEENVAPMSDFGKEGKLCDLNGDGLDDVMLGAWQYNNGQGRVWIYFNKPPKSK